MRCATHLSNHVSRPLRKAHHFRWNSCSKGDDGRGRRLPMVSTGTSRTRFPHTDKPNPSSPPTTMESLRLLQKKFSVQKNSDFALRFTPRVSNRNWSRGPACPLHRFALECELSAGRLRILTRTIAAFRTLYESRRFVIESRHDCWRA
jgi:hypothetical protein